MPKTAGKIVAVVGAPGCGKSYLVKKLAPHYHAQSIREGEEKDLPHWILDGLVKRGRNLGVFLWFRNKLAREMRQAHAWKEQGRTVVMDTFWMANETYIESFFRGFERRLARELSLLDRSLLPLPDVIVRLDASRATIESLMQKRRRSFDAGLMDVTLDVQERHRVLFAASRFPNLVVVNRNVLDFNHHKDLARVTAAVDAVLAKRKR
jgi:deoxyadenosine/deoxycytidine kinase